MGLLDRTASAFLSVVHVLSLLRPGSRQSGGPKLNVTVHEGKVGRQSQGKYLVTVRHGKKKMQTAKKKSDALLWEHSTEFIPWSPTDQLVLKLRKSKRCKDTTVGELSIDVAAAVESVDGLPQKWWYIMDRPNKGGRRNEEVYLQVSVSLDGTEVKSHRTDENKVSAKPSEETVEASAQGKSETLSEPQNHQVKAVAASQENELDAQPDNSAADSSPPFVAGDIDIRQDSSEESDTASTSDTADKFAVHEDMDVPPNDAHPQRSSRNTDVTLLQVPGAADNQERESELPKGKTAEGTVKTELQEKPDLENAEINVSQEKEPSALSDNSGKDCSPPSAAGDAADVSAASSTSSAFNLPASSAAEKRPAAGEGDVPERHPSVVYGKETEAPDNIGSDTYTQTTTSTQGEGSSVTAAATTPSPKHKDAEDPQYEEVMSSINKQWAELPLEREYAEKLLAHAESLRSRLATTAPKVLLYPVLKNIVAAVPDRTSYELPDTQGLSLVELQGIQKTLTKSVQNEKERATYIKRWYWEELVRVALKEAPQVFGPED